MGCIFDTSNSRAFLPDALAIAENYLGRCALSFILASIVRTAWWTLFWNQTQPGVGVFLVRYFQVSFSWGSLLVKIEIEPVMTGTIFSRILDNFLRQ